MFQWLKQIMSGKTKTDRQFELLDERLIDIQGKLKTLRAGQVTIDKKLDDMTQQFADLALMKEEVSIIHKLVAEGTGGADGSVLTAINNLSGKVDEFMATQEERLQAISAKIDEVLSDLAALKANNPQIEDEIAAIEAKLSLAQPSGGGETGGGPTP